MRVLLLVNSLCAGGAEVFVTDLAIALTSKGCRVAVFAYAGALDGKGMSLRDQLTEAGVQFISPQARHLAHKSLLPIQLASLFRDFKPDVVHSHLEQSDLLCLLAAKLCRLRNNIYFVRTIHSCYATKRLPKIAHQALSRFFDVSIACGNRVAKEYPFFGKRDVVAIDNGIRLSTVETTQECEESRRRLRLSKSSYVLINVGSFSNRNGQLPKSQDILIDALSQLGRSDVHLVFVGDGEKRSMIEEQVRSYGISDRVHFTGLVPSPSSYIQAADVVVMPSRFEGLSISCIEAACMGKPLIVSNIDAFAPFRGTSALEVSPNNAALLAVVINQAIQDLPQLKRAALKRQMEFRKMFDIDRVAEQYLNAYRGCPYRQSSFGNKLDGAA